MLIRFLGPNGKPYEIKTDEVVVLTDGGTAVATSYVHQGSIIHSDATQGDWGQVCAELGLHPRPVEIIKV